MKPTKPTKFKYTVCFSAILMTFLLLPFSALAGNLSNTIVAIVNNQAITQYEVQENAKLLAALNTLGNQPSLSNVQLQQTSLQALITEAIALTLAKKAGITTSTAQAKMTIQAMIASNHATIDDFEQQLTSSGISYKQYLSYLKKQLTIQQLEQRMLAPTLYLSPQAITNYIEQNPDQFYKTSYQLEHILFSKKPPQKVIDSIVSGKIPFQDAAKKYSQADDANSGGDMGMLPSDQLPPAFVKIAQNLKINEISKPFTLNGAIQIIKLIHKKTIPAFSHEVNEYHVYQLGIKLSPLINDSEALSQLNQIKISIKNLNDFKTAANQQSQLDTRSASGDMGWIILSQQPPTLKTLIKTTPLNTVSNPIKVDKNWQIIYITGKHKKNDTKEYTRLQARKQLLIQKMQQAMVTWRSSLESTAYIKILDPKFKSNTTSQ